MKYYAYEAVMDYVNKETDKGNEVFVIGGCLLDSYVVIHHNMVEILKETYVNAWQSTYTRHVYRKRVPEWLFDFVGAAVGEDGEYLQDCIRTMIEFNEERGA